MEERRTTPERRKTVKVACEGICDTVKRLDKELNGNGQPGLRQDIQAIREHLASMDGAAAARDREATKRYRQTALILAALTVVVGMLAIPPIAHAFHVGDLKVPAVFSYSIPQPEYTVNSNPPLNAAMNRHYESR